MQIALDGKTNDFILKSGGGIERVHSGRFVVQQCQSKLKTWLGEWILDRSVGWINQEDFEKSFDQFNIERRARQIILGTQGVLSIVKLESTYSKRKLTMSFEALTTYGLVDLTIPWET